MAMKRRKQEKDEVVVNYMEVPRQYIPRVIGAGGSRISRIGKETGTNIDARDQSTDPCRVRICGPAHCIEMARSMIDDILAEVFDRAKSGVVLEIPAAKIGKVIGIRGAQINQIQSQTGAKLDVDKKCDPCKVRITGNDANIAHAEKVVLSLAMEVADQDSEYLDFPRALSGAILGVRGARIQSLQAQSGARIDVDKTQANVCRVRIDGTPAQREKAKQLIQKASAAPPPTPTALRNGRQQESSREDQATASIPLPKEMVRVMLNNIHLVQAHGIRAWVDFRACKLDLIGYPEAVETARKVVASLVGPELSENSQEAIENVESGVDQWEEPEAAAEEDDLVHPFTLYLDELLMFNRPGVPPSNKDCEVFIDDLPAENGSQHLADWLGVFGKVFSVHQIQGKNSAYVQFVDHTAAALCVESYAGVWSESERAITGDGRMPGRSLDSCAYPGSLLECFLGNRGTWKECLQLLMDRTGVQDLVFSAVANTRARFIGNGTVPQIQDFQTKVEELMAIAHDSMRELVQICQPRMVVCSGLPDSWMSQTDLVRGFFEPFGEIESLKFVGDNRAEVTFLNVADADWAVQELNGTDIGWEDDSSQIQCEVARVGVKKASEGDADASLECPQTPQSDEEQEEKDQVHGESDDYNSVPQGRQSHIIATQAPFPFSIPPQPSYKRPGLQQPPAARQEKVFRPSAATLKRPMPSQAIAEDGFSKQARGSLTQRYGRR